MAGFIYFLPGEINWQESLLAKYGIEHIRDLGDVMLNQGVINGPSNRPGLLVGNAASGLTQADVRWSDKLDFRPFPKSQAAGLEHQALCCWVRGDMPTPEVLARRKQLSGEILTLADNRKWLVPNARRWTEGGLYVSTIPKVIGVDEETGEYIAKNVPVRFRKLNRHAEDYFASYMAAALQASTDGSASIIVNDPAGFMFAAIEANYRVSAFELDILEAIEESDFDQFVSVIMDRKAVDVIQKKTEFGTTNT